MPAPRPVRAPRRRRGSPRGTLGGVVHAGRPAAAAYRTALRTRALAWVGQAVRQRHVLPLILAEEGREVQAYLGAGAALEQSPDAPGGGGHRSRFRRPRARAVGGHGPRGGAVARRRRRRLPAQRGLRLQRRADGQLRPGRRRDRRERRAARGDHQRRRRRDRGRVVDGRQRLPGGEERGRGPGAPDRHGAPRDATDAGPRGGRARRHLRGEGTAAGYAHARPHRR